MANTISFSKAFQGLGIEFEASEWTLEQLLNSLKEWEHEDIRNLCDLAIDLRCIRLDVILSTYTDKQRNTKFSIPRVHLNAQGDLCMFMGRNLEFPLTFDPKTKRYQIKSNSEMSFKVQPVKNKEDNLVSIAFVASVTKASAGFEEDFDLSLNLIFRSGANLVDIISTLQKGGNVQDKGIVQIGVGSGFYEKALKPWMLAPGHYKVLSAERKEVTKKDGTQATIYTGQVALVTDGKADDSAMFPMSLNGNPIKPELALAVMKGQNVYFTIGGAYKYDSDFATIGFASRLTENSQGYVDLSKWKAYTQAANRSVASMRSTNSSQLVTAEQIEKRKQEYLNLSTGEPKKELVAVGAKPDLNEVPF